MPVLPPGFIRIRHFGLLANWAKKEKLKQARKCLAQPEPEEKPEESTAELMLRLTGFDVLRCSYCQKGRWQVIATFCAGDLDHRRAGAPDTS